MWVRGYGLRDSQPVKDGARRARHPAGGERAARRRKRPKIYPANYWLSLLAAAAKALALPIHEGESRAVSGGQGADEESGERRRDATRAVSTGSGR